MKEDLGNTTHLEAYPHKMNSLNTEELETHNEMVMAKTPNRTGGGAPLAVIQNYFS